MSIILGFGCVEEQVGRDVKNALVEGLANGQTADSVLSKWNSKADEYDKLPRETAPERYTRVWHYDDALHFHHINRQHPFSPDGWACLVVVEPFFIAARDAIKESKQ